MATEDERQRVSRYVWEQLRRLHWDDKRLEIEAALDPKTTAAMLKGSRYPNQPTRERVEVALGIDPGTLERVRLGHLALEEESAEDPVERAINDSPLSRSNKLKLAGLYYEMLESQTATDRREVGA